MDPTSDPDETNPRAGDVIKSVQRCRDSKGYKEGERILPVICGGTMMYLQWLVHGAPDAMRPSPKALELANEAISTFKNRDDFQGAKDHVASFGQVFEDRVSRFCGDDWYVDFLLILEA